MTQCTQFMQKLHLSELVLSSLDLQALPCLEFLEVYSPSGDDVVSSLKIEKCHRLRDLTLECAKVSHLILKAG